MIISLQISAKSEPSTPAVHVFLHQTTILCSAFALPPPKTSQAGSRGRWPNDEALDQKRVGAIPPSPKPDVGILQYFQRLPSWPQSPAYLHGDVVPRGQALADSGQRGLLDVPDAPVDAVNGVVTFPLSRGLVPGRDTASRTRAPWSASPKTCCRTGGPGAPVYFLSHSIALGSEFLTLAWQCFSA